MRSIVCASNALTAIVVCAFFASLARDPAPAFRVARTDVIVAFVCIGVWLSSLAYAFARWRRKLKEVEP